MNPLLVNPLGSVANNKYKTTLCRHFATTGTCTMGIRCHFAHGNGELRTSNDPIEVNQAAQQEQLIQIQAGILGTASLKHIKCKHHELGICKNGDNCQYAHGDTELKMVGERQLNQLELTQQYQALLLAKEKLKSQKEVGKFEQQQNTGPTKEELLRQVMSGMGPSYNVHQDPMVQKEITSRQLQCIIDEISKINLPSAEKFKLGIAQQLITAKNVTGASYAMSDLIYQSQHIKENLQKQIGSILDQSSELALTLMAEYKSKYGAR